MCSSLKQCTVLVMNTLVKLMCQNLMVFHVKKKQSGPIFLKNIQNSERIPAKEILSGEIFCLFLSRILTREGGFDQFLRLDSHHHF